MNVLIYFLFLLLRIHRDKPIKPSAKYEIIEETFGKNADFINKAYQKILLDKPTKTLKEVGLSPNGTIFVRDNSV